MAEQIVIVIIIRHTNTEICLALVLRYQCLCRMRSLFVFRFASVALYNIVQLVTINILHVLSARLIFLHICFREVDVKITTIEKQRCKKTSNRAPMCICSCHSFVF